jgi:hypothetical protein
VAHVVIGIHEPRCSRLRAVDDPGIDHESHTTRGRVRCKRER